MLRCEVGIFGATMMGLGAIDGTGIFVSIGNAASVAGSWVVVAIAVAAVVAGLNGLSSAQTFSNVVGNLRQSCLSIAGYSFVFSILTIIREDSTLAH